jgi:fatty-acyl-CoA synthase
MTPVHPLDATIAGSLPSLRTTAELVAFEATPYAERVKAASTWEAIGIGASIDPQAPALQFLRHADPDETPRTFSHAAFVARATQAANAFHGLGVGPGDVVSVLLPLLPQTFFALFGAQAAGIANPVNPLLSAAQIAEILRAAGTKVLVALGPVPGSDIDAKVREVRDRLPGLQAVLRVHGGGDAVDPATHDFDALLDRQPADRLVSGRRIEPGDTAGYFHTGGTTGTPKLVRHSHANQVYQAWAMGLMLPFARGSLLFGLPLFHVGGALTQGLSVLSLGGTLVVVSPAGWREPAAVKNIWRLVERYRPRTVSVVPTVMAAALQVPLDGADVSSLECVAAGGSAIPVPVGRACREILDVPAIEVYGMTETSSVHTMSYRDRPVRLGATGHALPYSRTRVVRIDGEGRLLGDCSTNEIGVIAMAGPGVFSGYLSETHNRGAFVEPGWVNSGDLGRLDEDGYLWVTGRAKDLIIRGGHNIDPMAIEEVFFQHPAVALAAVVGEPDAYAGELPVAFVQRRPGATVEAAELLAFVRERTPERAAVPVQLYFVDTIPLTAVGKVFKPALRLDAAERAVKRLLADLAHGAGAIEVEAGAHAEHGNLLTVRIAGVAEADRPALQRQVDVRLDPLTMKHTIAWS